MDTPISPKQTSILPQFFGSGNCNVVSSTSCVPDDDDDNDENQMNSATNSEKSKYLRISKKFLKVSRRRSRTYAGEELPALIKKNNENASNPLSPVNSKITVNSGCSCSSISSKTNINSSQRLVVLFRMLFCLSLKKLYPFL